MAITSSIPALVGEAIEKSLKKNMRYALAFNENWSGDLAGYGSSLVVPSVGAVSTGEYTRYAPISWEDATDSGVTLPVDQQQYYAVRVDSLDRVQSRPELLGSILEEAVYSMNDTIDQFLASKIVGATGLIQDGLGDTGSAVSVTSADVFATLVSIGRKLDDAKVPRNGRYTIVPPWFHEKLVLSGADVQTDNSATVENGIVGRVAGFNIAVSNNVPAVGAGSDEYQIVAGAAGVGATMALQLMENSAVDLQDMFGVGLKGIALYGAVTTKPGAIAMLTAKEGTEA